MSIYVSAMLHPIQGGKVMIFLRIIPCKGKNYTSIYFLTPVRQYNMLAIQNGLCDLSKLYQVFLSRFSVPPMSVSMFGLIRCLEVRFFSVYQTLNKTIPNFWRRLGALEDTILGMEGRILVGVISVPESMNGVCLTQTTDVTEVIILNTGSIPTFRYPTSTNTAQLSALSTQGTSRKLKLGHLLKPFKRVTTGW